MISPTSVVGRDPALEALLDLDGQQFTIEPNGYSVKFDVRRVPVTLDRPHGISYSLTLHAPDGTRLVGFDNAHAVRASRGPAGARKERDHRHRFGTTRPYRYSEAGKLLEDFWQEVYVVLDELGVKR
ncbi:MAG: toxin-antitoxin system TumE family protein [bacterium]